MTQIQPAVKKETLRITYGTLGGSLLMFAAFFILHRVMPETVPFDYRVILGGLGGSAVAIGNFFMMGLTVQKVTAAENEDQAFRLMKASFKNRALLQLLWAVLALALPVFNGVTGIAPLFFPSLCIKTLSILGMIK